MGATSDLTIILTLKGRHLHTLRWLWHANRINFPFSIVVADGEVHSTVKRIMSDPQLFSNLKLTYLEYNDNSLQDYYFKLCDVMRHITTPYVMMSDNDDFPILAGLKECIKFLDVNGGYVCAGGQVTVFTLVSRESDFPSLTGSVSEYNLGLGSVGADFSAESSQQRVLEVLGSHNSFFYHVFKKEVLTAIFEENKRCKFNDLVAVENFVTLRAATFGKVKTIPSLTCYLRQAGTSSSSSFDDEWFNSLFSSRFYEDYLSLSCTISEIVCSGGQCAAQEFKVKLMSLFFQEWRRLFANFTVHQRLPRLLWIKNLVTFIIQGKFLPVVYLNWASKRRIFALFARNWEGSQGPDSLEKEFREIEYSLSSHEFSKFLASNAKELLD